MGSPRPTKLVTLTQSCKAMLCKAYVHAEHRVLGGQPRIRETLAHFKFIVFVGQDKSGYEKYILTPEGVARAAPLVEARQAVQRTNEKITKERSVTKVKAALFDVLVDTLVNKEVGAKTIDLLNGCRARFDRSGPSKLLVQIIKHESK